MGLSSSTKKSKKVALGYNSPYPSQFYGSVSVHAEMEAMSKLLQQKSLYRNKKITLDLLVIRVTRSLALANSKPCAHCLNNLFLLEKRGIILRYIYYSVGSQVARRRFSDLYRDRWAYISLGWQKRLLKQGQLNKEELSRGSSPGAGASSGSESEEGSDDWG